MLFEVPIFAKPQVRSIFEHSLKALTLQDRMCENISSMQFNDAGSTATQARTKLNIAAGTICLSHASVTAAGVNTCLKSWSKDVIAPAPQVRGLLVTSLARPPPARPAGGRRGRAGGAYKKYIAKSGQSEGTQLSQNSEDTIVAILVARQQKNMQLSKRSRCDASRAMKSNHSAMKSKVWFSCQCHRRRRRENSRVMCRGQLLQGSEPIL